VILTIALTVVWSAGDNQDEDSCITMLRYCCVARLCDCCVKGCMIVLLRARLRCKVA
jgi:hypothetical protein